MIKRFSFPITCHVAVEKSTEQKVYFIYVSSQCCPIFFGVWFSELTFYFAAAPFSVIFVIGLLLKNYVEKC